MARPRSSRPTDRELEILQILWQRGSCGLGEIHAELQERRSVAKTTVATVLKTMLEKNLVKRSDSANGYVWSARATQEATTRGSIRTLLNQFFDGSAKDLVAHVLEEKALTEQEREELRRMLEEGEE